MENNRFRTTFLPTMSGLLYTNTAYTETGRTQPTMPIPMRYSVVRLRYQSKRTSVRTDMSGTQGRAEEQMYDARLLVHPEITPELGQAVHMIGKWFEIQEVQPKYSLEGFLNHWQVDLDIVEKFD